jgi:PAS domain S-box-containing protein
VPEQIVQIEHILKRMQIGVAILSGNELRCQYANPYLLSLLGEPWRTSGVHGLRLDNLITADLYEAALPVLEQVRATGQSVTFDALAYEGFLQSRGRTYWKVGIERIEPTEHTETPAEDDSLMITIEDVTDQARSQLYLNAVHYISSAIASPYALPRVLDRILQAVHEMVGSTRCAILLIDQMDPVYEEQLQQAAQGTGVEPAPTITIAAQRGIHLFSYDWHPRLSEQLLLTHTMREQHALIIEDTRTVPEMQLPFIDDRGAPRRPGSVLSVPIFEPAFDMREAGFLGNGKQSNPAKGQVLGTIEVYHRGARGFPAEEVELLGQFARQAGLAIYNTRLLRSIDRLARVASRNARQRENVMQAIPDGVIIYDARWRVVEINQATRKLLGWTDDVIGLPVTEAMAYSKAQFLTENIPVSELVARLERQALEGKIDEFKLIGADGIAYTMRRSQAPIHDELGNIFAFVVVYHNVTEQAAARERIEIEVKNRTAELAQRNAALQLAREAQELANKRLQLLLERLPSGVMLISAAHKSISIINHVQVQILQRMGIQELPEDLDTDLAIQRILGHNIEEILRPLSMYRTSGAPMPYEEHPLAVALQHGEASEAEILLMTPDGQPLHLLASAAPLRDRDGNISSVVSVWHDITRMKMLERAREDFFTTLAHELKTPLANIRAHLSALLSRDLEWTVEEQLKFLQTADEQVERLAKMINYFLDASRVEAGALRLELEPILLPELFEDLQERLQALIDSSHRNLEIVLPPQLPAVMGDYELIINVLTNLLSNAFRYAPEKDTVRIEAETVFDEQGRRGVELRVIDRGPGMTQERQAELFTRFSTFASLRRPAADRPGQPESERREGKVRWSPATGLGLYISKGIIEAHGSKLQVKSSPGEGATFSFILSTAHSMKREA